MRERSVSPASTPTLAPLGQDERGVASTTVSMIVALAVFLAAVGGVLLTASEAGEDAGATDAAAEQVRSEALADLLIVSPGVGWSSGADSLVRLGLGATNGSGLQQSSINSLKGAMVDSANNGKVDYEEAQESLGLDPAGGRQFHVRIYPVGMGAVYDSSLSGLHAGYIGDWTGLPSVAVPATVLPADMPAYAQSQLNNSMGLQTVLEREALRSLGLDYEDGVHITATEPTITLDNIAPIPDVPLLTFLGLTTIEGDVYPDHKQYLDSVLIPRLPQYDLLIVGSGVDHSSLTANAVKDGIRDWTLAGGTLVVLGSASQSYQWLQPLFFTGVSTVNGAPIAPDVSHPLLKEPSALDWTKYDSHNKGWDIKSSGSGAHYDDFSHIIVQGGEDVMAVSKDGAFGSGRIILTTYMPREIASTLGLQEAMNFLENIVLFTDRAHLYLEYGPAAPPNTPVSVAVRQSWLWDSRLGQVPVRIEVHTWED